MMITSPHYEPSVNLYKKLLGKQRLKFIEVAVNGNCPLCRDFLVELGNGTSINGYECQRCKFFMMVTTMEKWKEELKESEMDSCGFEFHVG